MTRGLNELLKAVSSSSESSGEAFAELMERYAPLIDTATAKFSSVYSDSDDIRQEAVIALYFAALAYDHGSISGADRADNEAGGEADGEIGGEAGGENKNRVTFGLFAKICVNNRLTSVMRKIKAHRRSTVLSIDDEHEGELARLATDGDELSDRIIKREDSARIRAAAESELSAYEMSVFNDYVNGAKLADIAKTHKKTEKSVNNALFRIRSKLRRKILQNESE